MAITVNESAESRSGTQGEQERRIFIVRGTEDRDAAETALLAHADCPVSITSNGKALIRQPVQIDQVYIDSETPAACIWRGEVLYKSSEKTSKPPETGDSRFSFDTTGGTEHITQSLGSRGYTTAAQGFIPNQFYEGAINVTAHGVQGVEIGVMRYAWSETHYIPAATVTDTYKGKIRSLTYTTNNALFKGHEAGECLFTGAQGSQRGAGEDWEITFNFIGSPNRTGISIGTVHNIEKKGHEYLWVVYEDEVKNSPERIIKKPVEVFVEQVYYEGDFEDLGIGT